MSSWNIIIEVGLLDSHPGLRYISDLHEALSYCQVEQQNDLTKELTQVRDDDPFERCHLDYSSARLHDNTHGDGNASALGDGHFYDCRLTKRTLSVHDDDFFFRNDVDGCSLAIVRYH